MKESINVSEKGVGSPASTAITKSICEEDESYAKATTGSSINITDNNTTQVLGSIWDTKEDQMAFNFSNLVEEAKSLPATKRSILKIATKVFDPLGFLSPFTIQWKVLLGIASLL